MEVQKDNKVVDNNFKIVYDCKERAEFYKDSYPCSALTKKKEEDAKKVLLNGNPKYLSLLNTITN